MSVMKNRINEAAYGLILNMDQDVDTSADVVFASVASDFVGGANAELTTTSSLGIVGTTSAHGFRIKVGGVQTWEYQTSGHMVPVSDNAFKLGAGGNRVNTVFVGTGGVLSDGVVRSGSGVTGSRPTPQGAGTMWFDTTLGIPIWHDGTNWIDAAGTTV